MQTINSDSAAKVVDEQRDSAASKLDTASDRVRSAADYVRDNDAKGMLADVQRVAKKNPGVTLLTAAALGFVIARLFARARA